MASFPALVSRNPMHTIDSLTACAKTSDRRRGVAARSGPRRNVAPGIDGLSSSGEQSVMLPLLLSELKADDGHASLLSRLTTP